VKEMDGTSEQPAWASMLSHRALRASARCRPPATNPSVNTFRKPPAVAFCISGAARTFTTPLVLTAVRYNLLNAFSASSDSRVFLSLKVLDSDKNHPAFIVRFKQHHETSVDAAVRLVHAAWLSPMLGEAVIINGSGSFSGAGYTRGATAGRLVVSSDADAWKNYKATRCNGGYRGKAEYRLIGNNEERLLLNHLGIGWCKDAVLRYEVRWGREFDLVLFARPDLLWLSPVTPWCGWDSTRKMLSMRHGVMKADSDMFYVLPRRFMNTLLNQAVLHRDCTAKECCGTSENLLRYTKSMIANKDGVQEMDAKHQTFIAQNFIAVRQAAGFCRAMRNNSVLSAMFRGKGGVAREYDENCHRALQQLPPPHTTPHAPETVRPAPLGGTQRRRPSHHERDAGRD